MFALFVILALMSALSFFAHRGYALASRDAHDTARTNRSFPVNMQRSRELNLTLRLQDSGPDAKETSTDIGAAVLKRAGMPHPPYAASRARILPRTNNLPDRLSHLLPPGPHGERMQAEEIRRATQTASRNAHERKWANIQTISRACQLIQQHNDMKYKTYCRKATTATNMAIRSLDKKEKTHSEHTILAPNEDGSPGMSRFPIKSDEEMKIVEQKMKQLELESEAHWSVHTGYSRKAHEEKLRSNAFKEGFKNLWDPGVHQYHREKLRKDSFNRWWNRRGVDYKPLRLFW